jgi:hypothetical protein
MFGMGGFELFMLAISFVSGVLGYKLAKRRNREAWLWAVLCVILPFFVIIILCLGVLPPREIKE